jgi:hypothetical protein
MSNNIVILIVVLITFHTFFIGYILGKLKKDNTIIPQSFLKTTNPNKNNTISIDTKKVVTDIKTDNLEKKYDSLGDIKTTKENISESVNKLKNLKR